MVSIYRSFFKTFTLIHNVMTIQRSSTICERPTPCKNFYKLNDLTKKDVTFFDYKNALKKHAV